MLGQITAEPSEGVILIHIDVCVFLTVEEFDLFLAEIGVLFADEFIFTLTDEAFDFPVQCLVRISSPCGHPADNRLPGAYVECFDQFFYIRRSLLPLFFILSSEDT